MDRSARTLERATLRTSPVRATPPPKIARAWERVLLLTGRDATIGTRPRTSREGASAVETQDGYARVFWMAFRRSANAMFLVDLDRRIVAVNAAGERLAGRSADALAGERFTTLLDEPADAPDDDAWRAQVRRGESFGRRVLRRPDGSTRVIEYAMRAARAGGSVLVLGVCLRERAASRLPPAHEPAPLSAREQDVVRRIALGEVTADICGGLHIAEDTVRAHVRNAMAKTGARTRAQLIAIALTEGLLDD
jgi:PAS domain S-box-containing protein